MLPLLKLKPIEINGKSYYAEIAVIKSTFLGIEDHGILTFALHLDYGGSGQGAGYYSFDQYDSVTEELRGSPAMSLVIRKILEVVGVEKWEDLSGKRLVALKDGPYSSPVHGIMAAPPAEGKYVIFADCFKDSCEGLE